MTAVGLAHARLHRDSCNYSAHKVNRPLRVFLRCKMGGRRAEGRALHHIRHGGVRWFQHVPHETPQGQLATENLVPTVSRPPSDFDPRASEMARHCSERQIPQSQAKRRASEATAGRRLDILSSMSSQIESRAPVGTLKVDVRMRAAVRVGFAAHKHLFGAVGSAIVMQHAAPVGSRFSLGSPIHFCNAARATTVDAN